MWLSSRFLCRSLQSPVSTPVQPLLQQNNFDVLIGSFNVENILFRGNFLKRMDVQSMAEWDGDFDAALLVLGAIVKYNKQAARWPFDQTWAKISGGHSWPGDGSDEGSEQFNPAVTPREYRSAQTGSQVIHSTLTDLFRDADNHHVDNLRRVESRSLRRTKRSDQLIDSGSLAANATLAWQSAYAPIFRIYI